MTRHPFALAAVAIALLVMGSPLGAQVPRELTVAALQGEANTIDPQAAVFPAEVVVVEQLYESLLTLDADLRPAPGAAESWEVSPDGLIWQLRLRGDGFFSDGQPVLAEHVVYAFQRLLNPALATEYAPLFVSAGIVGAAEYRSGQAGPEALRVDALDDRLVQFTLKRPVGFFPSLLTLWVTAPVRPDVADATSSLWAADPARHVGNGPFVLDEWLPNERATFRPNPYFRVRPGLERMTFLAGDELTAEYAAYLAGERDLALVPEAYTRRVLSHPSMVQEARSHTELVTFWLIFNTQRDPLSSPLVRGALARVIDREALVEDALDGLGRAATGIVPPGMPGFSESAGSSLVFAPPAARELLASAGFPGGSGFPALTFSYAASAANQRRADIIKAQLSASLNVRVVLNALDPSAYQAAYRARNFDMSFGGWGADYPDPANWYATLFGCAGENNATGYCNPILDRVIADADTSTDQARRLELYDQAQAIVLNDVPVVPLYNRGRIVLVKPHVQGLTITPRDAWPGSYSLRDVTILPR